MRRVHLPHGTRLVVTLLLFAILPVAATGFLTLREQDQTLRAEALGRAQQVAQLLASYVDLFVRERQGDLRGLADNPTFRSAVTRGDWRAVQRVLDAIARHDPALRGIVAVDSDGTVRAATGVAANVVGRDASVFPASAMARERRALVVSDPFPSLVDGRPILSLAVPILQGPGTPPVLGASVDLSLLAGEVRRVRLGAGGFAVVQTADGRIIVHPDRSRFLALASETNRAPALTRQGPTGAVETLGPDGTRDFTGFATVPEVNWVVLAHLPEREALAPLADLRRRALTLTGWLILLVLGAALMHGRVLARPLRELAAAARAMGSGDLTRRVPVRRADEVGEVASAFNEMAERRQEAEAALTVSVVRRDVLVKLSAAIAAGSEHVEIVRQVVSATARLLGVPYAALWRLDAEGARLTIAAEFVDPALGPLPPQPPIPFERSLAYSISREGQPAVVPDVRQDPRWTNRTWPGLEHLAAYVGVPLAKEGNLVGVLMAMDRSGRAFTDEEGELLQSLGAHAALALEKSRLLEEARQAAAQAHALVEVGKAITGALGLDPVLDAIVEKALEATGASPCAIYRTTPAGELELVRARGFRAASRPPIVRARREGLIGLCLGVGAPVWSRDILEDPRLSFSPESREGVRAEGVRAALAVPIVSPELRYGVVFMGRRHVHDHSPAEVAFAETLASQAGVALENARLYEESQRRAREASALAEVVRALSTSLDADRVLDLIVQEVQKLMEVSFVGLMTLDAQGEHLTYVKGAGLSPERIAQVRLRVGEGMAGLAVQQRVPVKSSNILQDARYRHGGVAGQEGFRSLLVVPLLAADRVLGTLAVFRRDEHEFSPPEVELLSKFAAQAAIAIENARLYADSERRAREAGALACVTRALTESLDVSAVAERIVESVQSILGVRSAGFRLIRPDGSAVALATDPSGAHAAPGNLLGPGMGISGRVVAEGAPVWGCDILTDPQILLDDEMRHRIATSGLQAFLGVPLRVKGAIIGVLMVADRTGRAFPAAEIELLQMFADHAAIALENARLFEDSQRRAREAAALARVARTLTESLDTGAVAERIVESVLAIMDVRSAGFRLVRPDGSLMALAADASGAHAASGDVMAPGIGISGRVVAEGAPVWCRDILSDPQFLLDDEIRHRIAASGLHAFLGVPLRAKGAIIGALTVAAETGRAFPEAEIELLQTFADHAAIAIENARLYAESREALTQLETLYEAARDVAESLDLDATLTRIAENARRLAGADRAFLWLAEASDGSLQARIGTGPGAEAVVGSRIPAGSGSTAALAFREGRAVTVEDIALSTETDRDLAARFGNTAIVAVPLRVQETIAGVLVCGYDRPRAFGGGEVEHLTALGRHAAIALENARLYAEAERRRQEAEEALANVKQLQGLLPICSYCKKIRDDKNYWQRVETYIGEHSDATFSHGICPDCYERFARPALERALRRPEGTP